MSNIKFISGCFTVIIGLYLLTCLDGALSFLNPMNLNPFHYTRAELLEENTQLQENLAACTGDLSNRENLDNDLKKRTKTEWLKSWFGESESYLTRQAQVKEYQLKLDSLRNGHVVSNLIIIKTE